MKESKVLKKLGLTSLDIQTMIINGLTISDIAKKYNVEYVSLIQAYKVQKKNYKYIDYCQPKKKVEDIEKVSFTFDRLYTEESLNENELIAYEEYNKKHKAYYEY
jgi:hypothetical protein